MGKLKTLTRRSFMVVGAALAGGAVFGVYQAARTLPNPLNDLAGAGYAANPYLIINEDGVIIVVPRAEMGQGVHTTLAAMVAEELDVAWEDIQVIHGPAAQVYYNGKLASTALPFAQYSETPMQAQLAKAAEVVPKVLALQVTGSSTSTTDAFDKMRFAGAAAREALKEAAAAQLGLDVQILRTENGQVIAPGDIRLSYYELALGATIVGNLRPVTLRDPSQWRYLGTSMPRVDMVAKVTGTASFGADIMLDGMRFAAIRVNPHLDGEMQTYDDSAARDMAGVEQIIPLPGGVAVVATNTWLAQQAANAIDVTWGPSPHPGTQDAMLDVIRAGFDRPPNSVLRDDGDVDAAASGAGANKLQAEYEVPFLAHATMEPMNATALFTGQRIRMWVGSQAPTLVRDCVADLLDISWEDVDIVTPYMGGGFGRRAEMDVVRQTALIAREMPGTPIKLTWSREEDMTHDFYRPAAIARFEGVVQNNTIQSLNAALSAPSVFRQSANRIIGLPPPGPDKLHVEGAFDQPYGIENYRVSGHLAALDVPIGQWRSVGVSQNAFFMESFIDEMAHAAGRDPLDMRIELTRTTHLPSALVLERLREMSGWSGQTSNDVGRGVALCHSFGTPCAQAIEVVQTDDGIKLSKLWIACDVGIALDPRIIESQMSGAAIFGLSAAIHGEITFESGAVVQQNFYDYELLRMHTTPDIEVAILENNTAISGVGEPGTPPAAPALANALFDLTGTRARKLPLWHSFDFVT